MADPRIDELTRTGMELYERAEKWRQALIEIQRVNRNPIIAQMIKQHLNT